MTVRIGIDLDNTIVCYDEVFYRVALDRGLIPAGNSNTKEGVRSHLVGEGRESAWTELQGLVYGSRMGEAQPFHSVKEFISFARRNDMGVQIISHRTRHPYEGTPYDLHQAAMGWLEDKGFFDPRTVALLPEDVFCEESPDAKIDRIVSAGCTHFVDDLPKLLLHDSFPEGTSSMLFDPAKVFSPSPESRSLHVFHSWEEIGRYFGA